MAVFKMPVHMIITSMIGQVWCVCKDYIAMHVQCLPRAIYQDTSVVAVAS